MSTTKLLALIRRIETGASDSRSYNVVNGLMEKFVGTHVLTQMRLMQILALQQKALEMGSPSTAVGAYQILQKTLRWLMDDMKLTGTELYDVAMQEKMAHRLLVRRGLEEFRRGRMSRVTFANNLAMEWASLPVVTAITGDKGVKLQIGDSYYKGDGLNKVLTSPASVLAAVDEIDLVPGVEKRPAEPPVVVEEKKEMPSFWTFLVPILMGQVRHVLTAFGGFLVANGWATQDDATAIAGGIAAAVGVLWSAVNKLKA